MPGGGDSTETKGTATGGAVAAEGGCRRDGAESRDLTLAPRSLWLASTGAHAPGCVMCVCVSTVRAECGMRVASRRFRSAVTITRVPEGDESDDRFRCGCDALVHSTYSYGIALRALVVSRPGIHSMLSALFIYH